MKVILLLSLLTLLASCGGRNDGRTTQSGSSTFTRQAAIQNVFRTPRGALVKAETGVTVSTEEAIAIDAGLQDTFDKSPCHGYTRALNHSDYIVAVLKSEDRDALGNPAYRLPCNQYCGTEYDKGGYILVAGEIVAVGEPYGNIIALPDHEDRYDHQRLAASFEAEHVVLSFNDGDKFEATKTHLGSGHPIYSQCPQVK